MKKSVPSLLLLVATVPAWAADAAPGLDRLVACADVQDTRQRLACFDREIVPFAKPRTSAVAPAAPATPPAVRAAPAPAPASAPASAPSTVPPPAAPLPPAAAPSFGEEQLSGKARPATREEEQVLHARIASIREVGAGAFLVSLDNGQAWRHEDQHLGSYLRQGEAVTITKATLGTYRLTRDAGDGKSWIRVKRVR